MGRHGSAHGRHGAAHGRHGAAHDADHHRLGAARGRHGADHRCHGDCHCWHGDALRSPVPWCLGDHLQSCDATVVLCYTKRIYTHWVYMRERESVCVCV